MKKIKITKEDWLVQPLDVLTVDKKGQTYLDGMLLDEVTLKSLKAEAKALKKFKIWAIIQETLRQKAIEKAVLHSLNYEQTLSGKMMIHSIGVFKSIVNVLEKYGDK